jgi:hypothetical protein
MSNSKVAPIISKATLISKTNTQSASLTPSTTAGFHFKPYTVSSSTNSKGTPSASSKSSGKDDKKKDIKKAENVDKKKEEKIKQKAEKAAKKVNI